jgi:hypothetical protein
MIETDLLLLKNDPSTFMSTSVLADSNIFKRGQQNSSGMHADYKSRDFESLRTPNINKKITNAPSILSLKNKGTMKLTSSKKRCLGVESRASKCKISSDMMKLYDDLKFY